jgi:hypothetical protein
MDPFRFWKPGSSSPFEGRSCKSLREVFQNHTQNAVKLQTRGPLPPEEILVNVEDNESFGRRIKTRGVSFEVAHFAPKGHNKTAQGRAKWRFATSAALGQRNDSSESPERA